MRKMIPITTPFVNSPQKFKLSIDTFKNRVVWCAPQDALNEKYYVKWDLLSTSSGAGHLKYDRPIFIMRTSGNFRLYGAF